ncbi:MAG: Luciferase-like monooxygenase [Thermoleophilia bacterium]|nr:Luciferase-like monooxygenase [Thermoleophilia bacterium]
MSTSPVLSSVLGVSLSILDVASVSRDNTPAEALRGAIDLAQAADRWGYERIWYAEHHNMPSIASSAPEVIIASVAAQTERIRVGSGGVMLPNHAPLLVAERFGTLEALHPGRIDLGIGRAPGSDQRTAWALRRGRGGVQGQDLPELLWELFGYVNGFPEDDDLHGLQATPGFGAFPPVWLLGSSGSSAQLAARLGLRFATAHHFSAAATIPSMQAYREHFRASGELAEPYGMVTMQVVVAKTEAEARAIADGFALVFLRMRQGGPPRVLPTAAEVAAYEWSPEERRMADAMIDAQAVGTPDQVIERLRTMIETTGASEIMATTLAADATTRMRSYELLADAAGLPGPRDRRTTIAVTPLTGI